MGHLLILGLLGLSLVELCLRGVQKIPFACSYLPGRSSFHITFWMSILLLVMLIDYVATFERQALESVPRFLLILAILLLATLVARWKNTNTARSQAAAVCFEAEPALAVMTLGLGRDGAFTLDS